MSMFHALLGSEADDIESTAVYSFVSSDVGANSATWKNRLPSGPQSQNILYNSSGLLANDGTFLGTITFHSQDGPNYTKTAARITFRSITVDSVNDIWKPVRDRQFLIGTYTFKCKIKCSTVGGTALLRRHVNSPSGTAFTVTDVWQDFTLSMTVNSTTGNNYFGISPQLSSGVHGIDVDELQLYVSTAAIPAYTDDGNDGNISKQYGMRYPILKNGLYISNDVLALHSPAYPVEKSWAAMTLLFAVAVDGNSALQALFSTIVHSFMGTSATTRYITIDTGEPVFGPAAVLRTGKLYNQGFVIIGMMVDSGTSSTYINEVLVGAGPGQAALKAQIFSIGGRLPNTSFFTGDIALFTIWDRRITAAEWSRAVQLARIRLAAMGAPVQTKHWYIAEGDSITAAFSPPQGESFAYRMASELFTGNKYLGHANLGTGGHTLAFLEGDLNYLTARIGEAKRGGGEVVVSILIGANDRGTLISTSAVNAYWVRLRNYYQAIKNTGAKLIAITCLPIGSAASNGGAAGTWETYRAQLNTLITTNPSYYDALADFGNPAVSIMGDVATTSNITYYAADGIHPYPGGHSILAGLIKPIIQSFIP